MIAATAACASFKWLFWTNRSCWLSVNCCSTSKYCNLEPYSIERLADVDALLNGRNDRLKLVDRRRDGREFGFLLGPLPVQRGYFRFVLRDLRQQKLPLHGDQRPVGSLRRTECGERIVGIGKRRTQASDIELRGLQVALEMIDLAFVHGGIEFDQTYRRH